MKTTKKLKCLRTGIFATVLASSLAVGPVAFAAPSKTDYIGEAKAKSIALTHAGVKESDTAYIICKLDNDDGFMEYDVEFYVGNMEYDYEINAKTGDVLSYDNDTEYNDTTQPPVSDANNYIGQEKAKSIALTHAGVKESDTAYIICKLDNDDGFMEYDVEFYVGNMEYDYEINAKTGDVLSYDNDTEYNDTTQPPVSDANNYIGQEKAKSIALKDAGVSESSVGYIKCEFDYDDGLSEYEVEWQIGKMEYEYTINALDGTILERETEYDD